MSNEPNITAVLRRARAGYYLDEVTSVCCLMCKQPIGAGPYREVRILARFGQMLFEHVSCPTPNEKGQP
jgi:hypothetical protein